MFQSYLLASFVVESKLEWGAGAGHWSASLGISLAIRGWKSLVRACRHCKEYGIASVRKGFVLGVKVTASQRDSIHVYVGISILAGMIDVP